MAYNTKEILRDAKTAPIPQYYNPVTDAYEPLQGAGNGNRVLLYDALGNPLFTDANPASVKLTGSINTLVTAPVTRVVTLTETPVSLTSKANLRELTVRNVDLILRARIGETGMTAANGKGIALEPQAIYQESFDPTIPVTIYGRSEGASMLVEVYEA